MAIKKKKSVKINDAKTKKVAVVKKSKKTPAVKKQVPLKKSVVKKKVDGKQIAKKVEVKNNKVNKAQTKKALVKKATVKKAAIKVVLKKQNKVSKSAVTKVAKNKIESSLVKKSGPTKSLIPKVELKISEVKNKIKAIEVIDTEQKTVKVGVKTKKQLIAVVPQPVIEVSNFPKTKVKTILISQPKPENDKNPYYDLSKKYNLIETFRQFIKIEGLPVKDFRNQRIDILEHKAVILTSRLAVDHYFRMCNEMRVTVPESMKYFCINEATAYYLQKYIQYRKRKIFFGHQTIRDLVDVIKKNKEEKFLLPASDVHREQICEFLDAIGIKYTKAVMYRTVSADLSDIKNLNDYDLLVFFTSAGINSLKQNFPNFKQGNTRIACFGTSTAETLKKLGYRLDIYAPNPKNPSMSGAIDDYIKEANKR
jgi:uroporphyrinogen-III synthase